MALGSRSILITHALGTPFAAQAVRAFMEQGALGRVATAFNIDPRSIPSVLTVLGLDMVRRELCRRAWVPTEASELCLCYPLREIVRSAMLKTRMNRAFGIGAQRLTDWVFEGLDRKVAEQLSAYSAIDTVYAYEDGAAHSFSQAKELGKKCVYDLPIAFYKTAQKIQAEEAGRFPELKDALAGAAEPIWKIERKEREISLADLIVVPSNFVRVSLLEAGIAAEKISVIPFGAPDYFTPRTQAPAIFRVLFVGRIGPRKGVHYLLQAWSKLKLPNAELVLVGVNEFPAGYIRGLGSSVKVFPSLAHRDLASFYEQSSIFVLPSLLEGLALVLLEAMSCGLPLIATSSSGAPDIMRDGVEGFITEPRDVQSLATKIEWFYRNPDAVNSMGKQAHKRASEFSWSLYRERLRNVVCRQIPA